MLVRLFFCLALINSFYMFSQRPKITHAIQSKDSIYFEYEDYDANMKPIGKKVFLKGCSWYCGGSVKSIRASSELQTKNNISYNAGNAHDFDKNTAWIEGKSGYGIGEYIEYLFDFSDDNLYKENIGINRLLIANGYKKNKKTWKQNSRIKQLKVYVNNEFMYIVNLIDSFEIQTVDIDDIMFLKNKITTIRFEILDIYQGEKHADTAISLLMFEGTGVH